jgi:hypothetical protein
LISLSFRPEEPAEASKAGLKIPISSETSNQQPASLFPCRPTFVDAEPPKATTDGAIGIDIIGEFS